MNNKIISIFGNDTLFGKIMNTCGVIVVTNLLFILFSIPLVTIGASASAMHYVLLKMRKEDEEINPFKLFFEGFKTNFKQATISWIAVLGIGALLFADFNICSHANSPIEIFKYPIGIMCGGLIVFSSYLFPVIATFKNKLSVLLQNTFFFICKNAIKSIVLGVVYFLCVFITYLDEGMIPLFAFIWFFFGFGTLVYITDIMLYKEFEPYLQSNRRK